MNQKPFSPRPNFSPNPDNLKDHLSTLLKTVPPTHKILLTILSHKAFEATAQSILRHWWCCGDRERVRACVVRAFDTFEKVIRQQAATPEQKELIDRVFDGIVKWLKWIEGAGEGRVLQSIFIGLCMSGELIWVVFAETPLKDEKVQHALSSLAKLQVERQSVMS